MKQTASTEAVAEFQILGSIAMIAGLTLVTSWLIMLFDAIEADKGMLNWARKGLDHALSLCTAAGSLTGGLLLTAIYTFDALALFSAGHLVLFNYPYLFRIAGIILIAGAAGYAYCIGMFAKSFAEMHTLGLSLASAMFFNSLLFFVMCTASGETSSVLGNCHVHGSWKDNWDVTKWEPSFVVFLVFLRYFTFATSTLGLSLSDRIDGGPDFFFKRNVSAIYQVRTSVMDGLDVLFRMAPLFVLTASSTGAEFILNTDALWRGEVKNDAGDVMKAYGMGVTKAYDVVYANLSTIFSSLLKLAEAFITYGKDLLLADYKMTLLVTLFAAATYCSFGSDSEGRHPIMPAFKEVLSVYVHHAKAHEGGEEKAASAKKAAAPSPKATGARSGSAKRK